MAELKRFFNEHKPKSTPGIFELALKHIEAGEQTAALDLCCGSGELTGRLGNKGYRAYGIDISSRFIGLAGEGAEGFVNGDVNCLPFATNSLSLVTFIDSLQYFREPEAIIAEIVRILRPQGTLILSAQNNFNPAGVKKWLVEKATGNSWSPWLVHPIENNITYPWLIRTLEAQGFEIEYVRGQQFLTAWVSLLPGFIRNWTPMPDKPWRTLAGVSQRVSFPQPIEESFLARFAMITFIRATKR